MLCKNCGAELPDNVKFCRMCGEKLFSTEQTAPEETSEPVPVILSNASPIPDRVDDPDQSYASDQQSIDRTYAADFHRPIISEDRQSSASDVQSIDRTYAANYNDIGTSESHGPHVQEQRQTYANEYQQPYAPQYQQPNIQADQQPYVTDQQQPIPVPQMSASRRNSRMIAFVLACINIFFISSVLIKTYSMNSHAYIGAYSFISDMGDSADRHDLNIFKYMTSLIQDSDWQIAIEICGFWVNFVFALLAAVAQVFAGYHMISTQNDSERKMWRSLMISIVVNFIGSLLMFAGSVTSNISYSVDHNYGIFENWGRYVPSPTVFAYIFLALELVLLVYCAVVKKRSNRAVFTQPQVYTAPSASPYNNF